MKTLISTALCSVMFLSGCQSTTQVIGSEENLLSAAGFTAKHATTPAQIASLQSLPANKFTQQNHNGQLIYLYADPVVCLCVYAGSQAAYSKYRQMLFQQNLANEQQMTAEMQESNFDFSPWGGFWGYW